MKKYNILFLLLLICSGMVFGQQQYRKSVKPVKNVILMIPDGTSTSVLSAARWYQQYNGGSNTLNLDPYLCGLVRTYSSNSPIPDSAPAMSAYMTGVPSQVGNIAIAPEADQDQDIYPIDGNKSYQPLVTVLEAAKIGKKKAAGVVVTVDFCHATPAACTSHYYSRKNYKALSSQMAYNNLEVVFGGGSSIITDDIKEYFNKTNTRLFQRDLKSFRNFSGNENIWALFSSSNIPYDIDREDKYPSLAEMTTKALERLDKEENGFFLMVEGSRIDMAAHATDPIGIITEFLAFDKAVGIALEYAKKNGETAVVILPDHGTSGFSFGDKGFKNYTAKGLEHSFANVSKYTRTAKGLEDILKKTKPEDMRTVFKKYTDIDLTDDEVTSLLSSKNYKVADYTEVGNTENLISSIARIMKSRTHFEFISGSHTGEDVFLAAYHPQGDIPNGFNTNIDVNHYLCDLVGLDKTLAEYTGEIFAKHTDVFNGYKYTITTGDNPTLRVKKGKKELVIPAFKSVGYLNNQPFDMGSVVVYIDKNDTFYVPKNLVDKLK